MTRHRDEEKIKEHIMHLFKMNSSKDYLLNRTEHEYKFRKSGRLCTRVD